jgi:hypothetical protein
MSRLRRQAHSLTQLFFLAQAAEIGAYPRRLVSGMFAPGTVLFLYSCCTRRPPSFDNIRRPQAGVGGFSARRRACPIRIGYSHRSEANRYWWR